MLDFSAALTHRIAPAILEFIRRTTPECALALPIPRGKDDAGFEALALELFAEQFALNHPFQALCRSRGVAPNKIRSWREIPAVPTAAFKDLEITCLPAADRVRVFHSSGTTSGRPGRNSHSRESLALYEASFLPWFAAHVLSEMPDLEADEVPAPLQALSFLSLTPPAAVVPHSSLVHMFDGAIRRFGARDSLFVGRIDSVGAWELDLEHMLNSLHQTIGANRPVILLGTAFNFVQLLDHLGAGNLRYQLAPESRVLETGGYKGRTRAVPKSELHAGITRHLGIPAERIGCEYGMCELASQAYDRPAAGHRRFKFPPWARMRIVSPENGAEVAEGQAGIIQVFDLANLGSVAAIQTGDLGVAHCDGSFELVGRAGSVEAKGCSSNIA